MARLAARSEGAAVSVHVTGMVTNYAPRPVADTAVVVAFADADGRIMWAGPDSAGLGASLPTWQAISTYDAAKSVAASMASTYCGASGSEAQRRRAAFAPWYACGSDACEAIYQAIYTPDQIRNVRRDTSVGREGGMVARTCRYAGDLTTFTCYYVNPSWAQGYAGSWQMAPLNGDFSRGPSPLSWAFYTRGFDGNNREWRFWIMADSGYASDANVYRPKDRDARASLTWLRTRMLCDVSLKRGYCPPGG